MALAIFDLDHTLLAGDSDYAWGQFLIARGAVVREEYQRENERYYAQYLAGELDIYRFLAFALRPLAQHDRATLAAWHAEFMRTHIAPMMRPEAFDWIAQHRARGDTLLIITATNRFITAPIAAAFGIEHLLATDPEELDGRFTGGVAGVPCFREGKIARLHAWLAQRTETLADSWFYSDSHNDLPLLCAVTHPVAVSPDPILAAHAERHGWPILLAPTGSG